ncbi:hypothetical protein [Methylobacterium indicum]|uniref:Uncharacterized protein n=1 Tax=Methylobacterium indicum TaxID=1775910 RepID=A0A8H8X100_9HYPH|nr:hypothetical protein [Methylobacterium indicum]BCM87892.1 hypothetical protein mvi_63530 [Methylobacterium indicum]
MPTGYTPIFQIFKGGENITGRFQDRAVSIRVDSTSGRGDQNTCAITIDDRDWRVARPKVGDYLEIHLGYEEVGLAYMGTFEIDEIVFEGWPKQISIHGNSQGNNSILKSQSIKEFEGKTVGEILKELGGKAGLDVNVNSDLAGIKIPFRNMVTSPSHLINQLEMLVGGIAQINDGKLSFTPQDGGKSASGIEIPIVVLTADHLAKFRVKHNNKTDYGKTRASYRDPDTGIRKWVESATGVSSLGEAAQAMAESMFTIGREFASKEEAERAAKSQMQALDRNLGEGECDLVYGDPWIQGQQRLLIAGTRDGVDGSYVVDTAIHIYQKQGGLKTHLTFQPPFDGGEAYQRMFREATENNDLSNFLIPEPGEVTGGVIQRLPDGRIRGGA